MFYKLLEQAVAELGKAQHQRNWIRDKVLQLARKFRKSVEQNWKILLKENWKNYEPIFFF